MSDLISRQAAIDSISKCMEIYVNNLPTMVYKAEAYKALNEAPSAQSEIVRCKDCRWGRETCGNIECFADSNVPPEYHGYEWFCPNGERRTDE